MTKPTCARCGGQLCQDIDHDIRCLQCGRAAYEGTVEELTLSPAAMSTVQPRTGRHTGPYYNGWFSAMGESGIRIEAADVT